MAREMSPQERARRAQLEGNPHDHSACGGCIYYARRTDAEGYCTHPQVLLDVQAGWWCKYHSRNKSHARLAGHPLHPALIPFPLALTGMALVFDILAGFSGRSPWRREATHALIAGTASGLLAAPSGMMDWLALPTRRPAKSYGLVHGLGNLLLLAVNGLNIGMRSGNSEPGVSRRAGEVGLSLFSTLLGIATGWLGGQLSYRHAVGVEPPLQDYRVLDVEPVARLSDRLQWTDGRLRIPEQSLWNGPAVPSEPVLPQMEERRAAS